MTTPRKLTRSRDQRIVAGVCGGLANYLNMDATLVRVVFAALTVFTAGTVGLLAYLVGVLVIPEESLDPDQIAPDLSAGAPPVHDQGFPTVQHPQEHPGPDEHPRDLR